MLFRSASAGGVPAALRACVAADIARMHGGDFYHIDLQWRNILVTDRGGAYTLHFLDSTRGGLRGSALFRAHGRARDLSSLYKEGRRWLTPVELLRWLRQYLGRPIGATDRAMIRTIIRDRAVKDSMRA